jgi:Zn-finger nucleic acid-binding protein
MAVHVLSGHLGRDVDIDACSACQAFWFDRSESLQLSPASTLKLFSVIGGAVAGHRTPVSALLRCPRCRSRLIDTNDLQRNTRFKYWRCPHGHGRFTTFFDFLREKDFVRALTAKQIEELRRNVQTLNCSNCGAPIDLARTSSCGHCGSPLSMLDLKQAEVVVAQLRRASEPRMMDPALPLELARARREVEEAFAGAEAKTVWWREASSLGLVEVGLSALARLLRKTTS